MGTINALPCLRKVLCPRKRLGAAGFLLTAAMLFPCMASADQITATEGGMVIGRDPETGDRIMQTSPPRQQPTPDGAEVIIVSPEVYPGSTGTRPGHGSGGNRPGPGKPGPGKPGSGGGKPGVGHGKPGDGGSSWNKPGNGHGNRPRAGQGGNSGQGGTSWNRPGTGHGGQGKPGMGNRPGTGSGTGRPPIRQ